MNSESEVKNPSDVSQEEPSVIVSIKRIQAHLVFLEKKIDTLIEQSKPRSFNKGKHFSKPHKSHHHSHRSEPFNQGRRFEKPWRGHHRNESRNKKHRFQGGQFHHGKSAAVHRS